MQAGKERSTDGEPKRKRTKPGAVFTFLSGILLTWVSASVLLSVLYHLKSVSWFIAVLLLVILPGLLTTGIALMLSPWAHIPIVERIIKIVTAPHERVLRFLESIQILNLALLVFTIVYVIPVVGWRVLELNGWAPIIPEKAYTYASLVLAAVVFTHWGAAITTRVTPKKRREQFANVFSLLRPNYIRVLIYGLMAIAYSAANWEKFSGLTFTNADWWSTYKDVLVEVLLTYTAIDAVLTAWKERTEKGTTQA